MKKQLATTISSIAHAGWLRLLLFTLAFITFSAAAPYLIYRHLEAQPLSFDPRLLSWPVLGGSLLLLAVYFGSDGLRLYHTLRALGQNLPKRYLGKLVFINILFSNLTPLASGGGFAQIWFLRRHGIRLGTATAATTVRTLLAMVFIFTPTPFLLIALGPLHNKAIIGSLEIGFVLLASVYLVFFLVVLLRIRWILILLDALLGLLHRRRLFGERRFRRWRARTRRELFRFSYSFGAYLKGPKKHILLSILYTATFLLALFSFPSLLFWGLGYRIDYLTATGLLLVATFIMYVSPTPGASGIAEGVFGIFFASMVASSDLVLVVIAWRFLPIYTGMLIGIPVTLHEILRKEPGGEG